MAKHESRATRFANALGQVSDARSQAEELRDELQNWLDNMPESLRSGTKAGELEEAISGLDDFISSCEDLEGTDITFPGMF